MKEENILNLIGNTPLVKVTKLNTGKCDLWLKLENSNPGGSIKDRIGLSMIEQAEKRGELKPGNTIIEATAGNTGLGLALIALVKGYKLILVIPDKMSREKILHLKAMGVEVILTRSDVAKGHPEYYQDMAKKLSEEIPNSYFINQFENPDNPLAHETTTGPEIFEQTEGKVDAVVCGIGSSGTLTGLTKFFKKVKPEVEMIVGDPKGSVIEEYVETGSFGEAGSWLVEGIGEDFIPSIADLDLVKKVYTISDEESFEAARQLLKKEGVLAGSSSGTLLAAALRYCQEQTEPKTVVSLVCDSGNKYLTKMFNDFWMKDNGLLETQESGNITDIISRKYEENEVVYARPKDTLKSVYKKLNLYDVSQIPVVENAKIVGIIDANDILKALIEDPKAINLQVEKYMSENLVTLNPQNTIQDIMAIFDRGMIPIVIENGNFRGLITQIDLLNYLDLNNKNIELSN